MPLRYRHPGGAYATPAQLFRPYSRIRNPAGIRASAAAAEPSRPDIQQELSAYLYQASAARRHKTGTGIGRFASTYHPLSNRLEPHANMAFVLPGLRRGILLSTPLILATPTLIQAYRRPILCEGPDPLTKITSDLKSNYAGNAQTPVVQTSGAPNPRAIRQISLGSILGVLAGLSVSVFSKPLAVLIGLGIVCVQVRL